MATGYHDFMVIKEVSFITGMDTNTNFQLTQTDVGWTQEVEWHMDLGFYDHVQRITNYMACFILVSGADPWFDMLLHRCNISMVAARDALRIKDLISYTKGAVIIPFYLFFVWVVGTGEGHIVYISISIKWGS